MLVMGPKSAGPGTDKEAGLSLTMASIHLQRPWSPATGASVNTWSEQMRKGRGRGAGHHEGLRNQLRLESGESVTRQLTSRESSGCRHRIGTEV